MRRFLVRLANLLRGRRAESEMAREMEAHLALLREDFERRGLSPREAALAARRTYGGVEQAKELHREARSFVWVEQLLQDVRYAWRNLLRNPGFTLVATLALALGIGANATIFGIYNAVALKQFPVADPSRVVRIRRWNRHFSSDNFSYAEYQYLRGGNSVFSGLTAASAAIPVLASIPGGGAPEHVSGVAVSANYFVVLGVNALTGRTFLPEDDRTPGADTVAVLAYRFWQRVFHGDPNAVGRTIKLNGTSYTVIGVASREFTGTGAVPAEAGLWAPLSMSEQLNPVVGAQWRDRQGFELLGRLQNGISRAQAQAQMWLLLRPYLAEHPEAVPTIAVTLHRTAWFGSADDPWFQAFAAGILIVVSMVLLVACANVANMLLARGVARHREIAIRLALGGSRARVVRQLLAESVLLSLLGGALGILLSAWGARLLWTSLVTIVQGFRGLQFELDLAPDGHVLLYGLVLSLVTGIVFGLAPALQSTRTDLHVAIHQDSSPVGGRLRRSHLRGLLLGAQVTVSVLLLVVSGGLMSGLMRSFVKSGDLGFETRDTYRIRVSAPKGLTTLQGLRARIERLPELSLVAMGGAPMQEMLSFPVAVGQWHGQAPASFASDGYFETLGIRLLRGRGFTRPESDGGAPVAVISDSTARRLWPDQEALGKHLRVDFAFLKGPDYEVVGIVRDARFVTLMQPDPLHVYLPMGTMPRPLGGLMVRSRGNRDRALAAIQTAVESVDPTLLPNLEMIDLDEGMVAAQRTFFRVLAAFAGILTLLALTLAGIGIYGVMAFLVSQRSREIGIRIALGASSPAVLRSVVIQGLRPVFAGTLLGLAGAIRILTMARASEISKDLNLFSRTIADPALFGELALVLAIALLASIIPAKRALRVDPAMALRHE